MNGFSIVNSAEATQIYGDTLGLSMLRDAIDEAIERGTAASSDCGGQARVVVIREDNWRPR
jgi:hypothetical protein